MEGKASWDGDQKVSLRPLVRSLEGRYWGIPPGDVIEFGPFSAEDAQVNLGNTTLGEGMAARNTRWTEAYGISGILEGKRAKRTNTMISGILRADRT